MLGATLHMLLEGNHLVGVLQVLVDIVGAGDLLLVQLNHLLLHSLQVVGDVEAIDEGIFMGGD